MSLGTVLIRKEVEAKHRAIQDKKERVKNALASNRWGSFFIPTDPLKKFSCRLLDTDVKRDALALAKAGQWDDAGPERVIAQGGAGGGTLANSQVGLYWSLLFQLTSISIPRTMSIVGLVWRTRRS